MHFKLRDHKWHNEYYRKKSPSDFLPLNDVCPVEEMAFVVCSLAALFTGRVRKEPWRCLNKVLWFYCTIPRQRWLQLPLSLDDSLGHCLHYLGKGGTKGVLSFLLIISECGQTGLAQLKKPSRRLRAVLLLVKGRGSRK